MAKKPTTVQPKHTSLARATTKRMVAALLLGALFSFTSPPFNFTASVPLALTGLYALLAARPSTLRATLGIGWAFGFGANLVALRFVPQVITHFTELGYGVGLLALVLLAAAQAAPFAITAAMARQLHALGGPRSVAFAIGGLVGTYIPVVFPWTAAGGLAAWPICVQSAELWGERGVHAVVLLICALAVDALYALRTYRTIATAEAPPHLPARALLAPLAVCVIVLFGGALRMRNIEQASSSAPVARVGFLQTNFDAKERWNPAAAPALMAALTTQTGAAEAAGAAFTLWPESAYPYALAHATRTLPMGTLNPFASGIHKPIITGVVLMRGRGDSTNSVATFEESGAISAPSDKQYLVPFGEHIPLAETFPELRRIFARGAGIVPGERTVFQVVGPVRATVLNCFEDTRTDASYALGQEIATAGSAHLFPNLLLSASNDAWFAGTHEPMLHARLAVLRAVEHRRDLVRAVNGGDAGVVLATGRVALLTTAQRGSLESGVYVENVHLYDEPTVFARFGDMPLALAALAYVLALSIRKQRNFAHTREQPQM
jgi:apolipoprotein N-acyltransferase